MKSLEEQMQGWATYDDVAPWVQEAASLLATVPGCELTHIAGYMQKSVEYTKLALSHWLVKQHIASLKFQVAKGQAEHVKGVSDNLTSIVERSVERIEELMPEASMKDAIAAAKFACEVHPNREFVKMEKREEKHTHTHHHSGALLDELKQRHLTAIKQPAIDVKAQVDDSLDEVAEAREFEEATA